MKIKVIAKPNKKERKIVKVDETTFKIYVTEPPEDGKANKAIAEVLAEYFKVPKNNIQLILGETAKEKIFVIL